MKTVFNNDMVGHVWAQQSQDNGKNSNDNFYFNGQTIFSYNNSFPIAKFVKPDLVLITTKSYSVTTSQHTSITRRAIPRYVDVFNVPNVEIKFGTKHTYSKKQNKEDHQLNVEYYKDEIKKLILQAVRARTAKDWLNSQAIDLVEEANNYIQAFKLRFKALELPNAEKLKADAIKAKKAKARKDKATARKIAKENESKVIQWRAGEINYLPYGLDTMLRIKGEIVQTSKNAEFPTDHARLALKIINRCRKNKKPFITNGKTIRLGYFKIDRIDINGNVKAGCHFVKYEQIKMIEKELFIND